MQSAENPGQNTSTDSIPSEGIFFQGFIGIGLQPFGHAKTRLKREQPVLVVQAQLFCNQACCLMTFAVIGVSLQQTTLWQSVKRKTTASGCADAAPSVN